MAAVMTGAGIEPAPKYRLSPSLIDSIEFYRFNTDNWGEELLAEKQQQIIAQIKRLPVKPTLPMVLGSAFHRAMETPPQPVETDDGPALPIHERGHNILFALDSVMQARENQPKNMVREVWAPQKSMAGAKLASKADGLEGNVVHEMKTTASSKQLADKMEDYIGTFQWRWYLHAYDMQVCEYHLYRLELSKKTGVYKIAEYLPFKQYRYPKMLDDLRQRIGETLSFIDGMGLLDFIRLR